MYFTLFIIPSTAISTSDYCIIGFCAVLCAIALFIPIVAIDRGDCLYLGFIFGSMNVRWRDIFAVKPAFPGLTSIVNITIQNGYPRRVTLAFEKQRGAKLSDHPGFARMQAKIELHRAEDQSAGRNPESPLIQHIKSGDVVLASDEKVYATTGIAVLGLISAVAWPVGTPYSVGLPELFIAGVLACFSITLLLIPTRVIDQGSSLHLVYLFGKHSIPWGAIRSVRVISIFSIPAAVISTHKNFGIWLIPLISLWKEHGPLVYTCAEYVQAKITASQ